MAFEKTHLLRFRKTNTAKKKHIYCEEKSQKTHALVKCFFCDYNGSVR